MYLVYVVQHSKPIERVIKVNVETDEMKDPKLDLLKSPQRKISRFLVSPVLSGQLDMPKENDLDLNKGGQEGGKGRDLCSIIYCA